MSKFIYMDNAATTAVRQEVVDAMVPYFTESYANPSSVYSFAQKTKNDMEEARETIASILGAAKPNEIYFTGGGSESDNWALKAAAEAFKSKGNHIITTKIEHHAILHTCEWLEKHGYEVTYLDVDEYGKVDPIEFEAAIKDTTILASIMFANNEIGTVEPIKELGAIAHSKGVIFHTDAVQAFAHIPINVQEMNIDMLSASGHKFHGPKGIGFLYVSNKVKIGSFIHGGSQERSRRAGTHNVPGIIGMAKAASIANTNMSENIKNISVISFVARNKVFKFTDFLLLTAVCSFKLCFLYCVDFLEMFISVSDLLRVNQCLLCLIRREYVVHQVQPAHQVHLTHHMFFLQSDFLTR